MRIPKRLLYLMEDALSLGVTLVSDVIDSWATGETREAILQKLREAVQRSSELALEKARLEEEVDSLRFNGPSLYRDEVEALRWTINWRADEKGYLEVLRGLLNRCDHLPMTAQELNKQMDDALSGRAKTYTWDEVFGSKGHDIDGRDCGYPEKPCATCRAWDFTFEDGEEH